ncbi:hypothetical protein SDC9_165386 [bioreactor metagenome]|uniref:DUF4352 domain-containing protein n=1 Tax=bioreactor metagenome TaxID=1076179 RepID=A0A645FU73_9ZZZZ
MKCPNCGAENDSSKVCQHCGSPLEQSVPNVPNQAYPQQAVPPMPVKVKKPVFTKWWFWLIAVVIVIGIVAAVTDKNPVKETNNNTSKTSTTTAAASAKDTFGLNETAVFKTLKITATELKESEGKEFNKPGDGKIFVGVHFTIENISKEEQMMSSLLLFDAYADGVKCDLSVTAAINFDGTLDGSIAPGKKMIGWYSVEIPKEWKELELQVKSSWLSSSKATYKFKK